MTNRLKKLKTVVYLHHIAKVHNQSVCQRLNGDPVSVLEDLEACNIGLHENGHGAEIGVSLQAQSEVGLRAGGIVVDGNVLRWFSERIRDV